MTKEEIIFKIENELRSQGCIEDHIKELCSTISIFDEKILNECASNNHLA